MKFCSECGACLEPTFKFCIKCGTRTSENICSTAEKSCNEVSRKENETAEDLEAGPSLKMGALDSNLALLKAKFEQSREKMAKKRKASFTPEVVMLTHDSLAVFSSPELKAQVSFSGCLLSACPSVNFSHFNFFFRTTGQILTRLGKQYSG
uniref:Uncharacterized protein LOC111100119 n=1 Tax=Crassostrea virginica TaxID=6565 RepID=A0A8B8AA70_CRAVI|nr:uncharacterized protein LOC111100119 [Crassostrea virginica]